MLIRQNKEVKIKSEAVRTNKTIILYRFEK